jgi:hypothetical protein
MVVGATAPLPELTGRRLMGALVDGFGQGVTQNKEETIGILNAGDSELERVGDSE